MSYTTKLAFWLVLSLLACGLYLAVTTGEARAQGASIDHPARAVPDLIHHYAAAYGANPNVMLRIAWCESKWGTHQNTNVLSNPHRGVFQWESASWAEVAPQIGVSGAFSEAYSAPSNIAVAAYALAIGQNWRWRACL